MTRMLTPQKALSYGDITEITIGKESLISQGRALTALAIYCARGGGKGVLPTLWERKQNCKVNRV